MIDWISVGLGALWIFGLGLILAALSFSSYLAKQQNQRFTQAIESPPCRIIIDIGLVLFCLGLAGGSPAVWERFLWAILALFFAVRTWQARKKSSV